MNQAAINPPEAQSAPPLLEALQGVYTQRFLSQHSEKCLELTRGLGSPVHFLFPQQMASNITDARRVFEAFQVSGQIFFAKKANKAACFTKVCREQNIGVDVASLQELQQALAAGISGQQLSVSGPQKSQELLQLAIYQGAQIALDSLEEIHALLAVLDDQAMTAPSKVKVLLRYRPPIELRSRFGLSAEQLPAALSALHNQRKKLELLGFSFHLSGYEITPRVQVIEQLLVWQDRARAQGFEQCQQINAGGGFPVSYVEPTAWRKFQAKTQPSDFHAEHRFHNGFYPYGQPVNLPGALSQLLSATDAQQITLAQRLNEKKVYLTIEPGRSLLDQTGISVFLIQGMKALATPDHYHIATVAGMSFSLSEQWFGSEFLPAPVLIKPSSKPVISAPQMADQQVSLTAIAGCSCLDSDMLSWRKIPFRQLPAIGDGLVYINTAGYQMDSNESPFHSIPMAQKISVIWQTEQLQWQRDSTV